MSIMVDLLQALRSVGDDMTAPQLLSLLCLSSRGARSVRALAEDLHLPESTIDALSSPLVARGLVIRIPSTSGSRESIVILSTAGHRLVDNLIYRQGSRSGAFTRLPVTTSDLHRRNDEALRLA
jgi:DNA-binding MarR family transcriptional regulator